MRVRVTRGAVACHQAAALLPHVRQVYSCRWEAGHSLPAR